MPSRSPQIGLLCQIAAGGFSGERVVQIPLPDARMHKGLAPTHYCWTRAERPLAREEPAPGVLLDGIVAARWLQDAPDGKAVVTIPDGDVIVVAKDIITPRPVSELPSHVSV